MPYLLLIALFAPEMPPPLDDLKTFPPDWMALAQIDVANDYERGLHEAQTKVNPDRTPNGVPEEVLDEVRRIDRLKETWSWLHQAHDDGAKGRISLARNDLAHLKDLLGDASYRLGSAGMPWATDYYGRLLYAEIKEAP